MGVALAKEDRGSVIVESSERPAGQVEADVRRYHKWTGLLIVVAIVFAVAVFLLARYFPFSEKNVTESVRETFPGTITIDHFHTVFFPRPGCNAEGVTFRSVSSPPGSPPLVTVHKFSIRGNYTDFLFRPHHISRVILEGLHVQIPPVGHGGNVSAGYNQSQTTTGEIIANGAIVEIARNGDKPPLRFDVRELSLGSVSAKYGMSYRVSVHNPEPPGEIKSAGHFGPYNSSDPGQTTMSGTYSFIRGDLGVFHGIAGMVSSEGTFSGPLSRVEAQASTEVPDFEVVRSGHSARLVTHFQSSVNAMNGDVTLNTVNATYINTNIVAKGNVAAKEGWAGKFTSLDFAVRDGRIQDLLRLVVKADRPPMSGAASLKAHVTVPPEGKPFLREVTLDGDFEIAEGHFENPDRQESVNKLSETARGLRKANQKDDNSNSSENVVSHLQGHVVLRNGVATFTELSFTVPGADAQMHGTYNVLNEKVDFHGTLKMDAKFSQSTSGIKSFFAKVLDPFFNKKQGSVIPVEMDGTYHHPHFGIELNPIKK